MKVCFLTHYSEMYGANQSLLLLIKYLSRIEEVDIHVFLPSEGKMTARLQELNIPTTIIPFKYSYCSSRLNWKGKVISCFYFLGDLLRFLFYSRHFSDFDIVYSNSSVISHGLIMA